MTRARRLVWAAVARNMRLNATGTGVGVEFAALRVPIPFWWLVGGALGAWVGLVLTVRGIRRAYSSGGVASGNRSSS